MGRTIGIYIGEKNISIAEVQGRPAKVIRQVSLPVSSLIIKPGLDLQSAEPASSLDSQVEILRDFLKTNKILAKEAIVGLSSKDLFIRGFQVPPLGRSEIGAGIRFEARKYLPSKTENLVFDYQCHTDKKLGRMAVLFTAIEYPVLNNYQELFRRLGLRVRTIEPASLALLRIAAITKQGGSRGSFAFMAIQDLNLEFSIVINGFPCFSRDVKLSESPVSQTADEGQESTLSQRLASEVRVSLDYFRRQFLGAPVEKVIFLARNLSEEFISDLGKGLGLDAQLVDLDKNKELDPLTDLDALKAYALGIKYTTRINLSIDLSKGRHTSPDLGTDVKSGKPVVLSIKAIRRPLMLAGIFLTLVYLFPMYEIAKVAKSLEQARRQAIASLGPGFSAQPIDTIEQAKAEYKEKLAFIQQTIKSRPYVTAVFNVLPRLVRQGLWINEFTLSNKNKSRSLEIKGAIYLGNEAGEAQAANNFLNDLKKSSDFMYGLHNLTLDSLSQVQVQDTNEQMTVFEISGN